MTLPHHLVCAAGGKGLEDEGDTGPLACDARALRRWRLSLDPVRVLGGLAAHHRREHDHVPPDPHPSRAEVPVPLN